MDLKLAPWQQDVAKKYQESGEVTVPSYVTDTTSEEQEEDTVTAEIQQGHITYDFHI